MSLRSDNTRPVLVLWDIDHTLIETRGVGRAAFADAFQRVIGHPLQQMSSVTGRTENDIYTDTIALHDIPDPPPFTRFADALASAYEQLRDQLHRQGRAMPGARETLAHLSTASHITQSVLTGNTRDVARIKLETFGLHNYLDLTVGAYRDDDPHRPALVTIARARATTLTVQFDEQTTVLIGDSLGDITTARHGGARIIAVAAGGSSATDLTSADAVIDDLADPHTVADLIDSLVQS